MDRDLLALIALVEQGRVVVLTGAGLSTGSGIPDYRGPTGAARPSTPMTFQEFTGNASARQRYWRAHIWAGVSSPERSRMTVTALSPSYRRRGSSTESSPRTSTGCIRRPAPRT